MDTSEQQSQSHPQRPSTLLSLPSSSHATAAGVVTHPPTPTAQLDDYVFPSHRLKRTLDDPAKTPLVLVACGSFSPITHMHLRMFEMAVDHVRQNMEEYEVVGGYISPVSDMYKKAGLAAAAHRIRMCELAADQTSEWLMVDPWEGLQSSYTPTAVVLDHFAESVAPLLSKKPQISLLCGADLLTSMTPGIWSVQDLDHILLTYGLFVIERTGSSIQEALAQLKELNPEWVGKVQTIRQLIPNDISSTSIRQFLRLGLSVHYLLPWCVIEYIREKGLYKGEEKRSHSVPREGKHAMPAGDPKQEEHGPGSGDAEDRKRGKGPAPVLTLSGRGEGEIVNGPTKEEVDAAL